MYDITCTILVDEIPAGRIGCESYGLRLTDRSTGETAQALGVTTDPDRIRALQGLLTRNRVSPIHLRDVIEDYLAR